MPIGTPTGYLDITNATLRGSQIVTTGYVGIANANPVNHLSVGSNLHINDTHSNVLQISGNINAAGVVLGGISIAPTFDLEIVTNTGNTTPYTVEFNNTATAFVTTANATIGDTLTASKLVGDGSAISAIQSSNVSDFASNVSRIATLETDLDSNVTRIQTLETNLDSNVTRIQTLETNLDSNVTRIQTLETDLDSNVTRIQNLESTNMTIDGEKTFSSNLEVGTANLFVDTTTGNVGIGTNSPTYKLQISGDTLVNPGEASWDTGMKSLMGTQDLINVGIAGTGSIGSLTASTDVDLPPDVVGDVIAKFVNSHINEVYTNTYNTGVVGVSGQDIVFNIWIYNSSGSTISSQLFVFGGQAQNVSFSIPSTSTWVKYTQTITLSAANSGNSMQLRMDNNTQGTTFYFTGLSVRVNPSNTTDAPFTPRGFPISGTGTVLSVPNIVAKEASVSTLHIHGNVTYPMVRWEVDLTSQSTSNFYPIEFTHVYSEGTPDLPDHHPIHFKIFGESLGDVDSYNDNTLVGYARGGGYSDHTGIYDIHITRYNAGEDRFQGIYEGTAAYTNGIVIYMRGGYTYSAITDANEVVTHTSAYTTTGGASPSTFAIKDVNGNDVSGTSANIGEFVDLATISGANKNQRWMSGSVLNENPAFFAYKSGGASTTIEGIWGETSQPVFNSTLINRGSCYDTSNGKFTAPVAGVYCFYGQVLHRYDGASGNAELTFYKNGANVSARALAYTQVVGASDHDNLRIHVILSLNAGDYVQIGIYDLAANNNIYYGEYLGNFSGYLIG